MKRLLFLCGFLCLGLLRAEEKPLVVTLHPILAQWVQELTGDSVEVVNLVPTTANIHTFEPSPRDLTQLQGAVMLVAMGKHLEPYLDRLKENIPETVVVVEAGRMVPSIKTDPELAVFACCPQHALSDIDPHWWQDPMSARRAVRQLGRELEKVFPEQKSEIRRRTSAKMKELKELDRWAKEQLADIPSSDRKLVTTHNAFAYFCSQYDFQTIPVRGTNNDRDPSPEELADTMEIIKREKVKALFPESHTSEDFLRAVNEASGIPLAGALSADFFPDNDESYESIFRGNVQVIRRALDTSQ